MYCSCRCPSNQMEFLPAYFRFTSILLRYFVHRNFFPYLECNYFLWQQPFLSVLPQWVFVESEGVQALFSLQHLLGLYDLPSPFLHSSLHLSSLPSAQQLPFSIGFDEAINVFEALTVKNKAHSIIATIEA